VNLAQVVLQLKGMGIHDPRSFEFLFLRDQRSMRSIRRFANYMPWERLMMGMDTMQFIFTKSTTSSYSSVVHEVLVLLDSVHSDDVKQPRPPFLNTYFTAS